MYELELIRKDVLKQRIREAETQRLIQKLRREIPKRPGFAVRILTTVGLLIGSFGEWLQIQFKRSDSPLGRLPLDEGYL